MEPMSRMCRMRRMKRMSGRMGASGWMKPLRHKDYSELNELWGHWSNKEGIQIVFAVQGDRGTFKPSNIQLTVRYSERIKKRADIVHHGVGKRTQLSMGTPFTHILRVELVCAQPIQVPFAHWIIFCLLNIQTHCFHAFIFNLKSKYHVICVVFCFAIEFVPTWKWARSLSSSVGFAYLLARNGSQHDAQHLLSALRKRIQSSR